MKKKYEKNPAQTIRAIPRDKIDQFLKLVSGTEDLHRTRNHLIFRLLLSTGMRVGEFSKIKVNDLEPPNKIYIPAVNTKNKMCRTVRVLPSLFLDLKEYLISKKIKNSYIWQKKNGKRISTHGIASMFRKYFVTKEFAKKLDLSSIPTPHTFRHTHAVQSMNSGVNQSAIQKNLGHNSPQMTQHYLQFSIQDVIKSYEDVDF